MSTTKTVQDRKSLESVLSLLMILLDTYQKIIASKEPGASQLRRHAMDGIGKLASHIARAEREIAKMKREEGGK